MFKRMMLVIISVSLLFTACDENAGDDISVEGVWEKERGYQYDGYTGATNNVFYPYTTAAGTIIRIFMVFEEGIEKYYEKECQLDSGEQVNCTVTYDTEMDWTYTINGNRLITDRGDEHWEAEIAIERNRMTWSPVTNPTSSESWLQSSSEEIYSNLAP